MADLEDFFAKRDKKKKKTPKGFEADDVAKILEKKRADMSKSSYQPPPAESTDPVSEYKAQEVDDEWREAVEYQPDFTGLKIQDLVEPNSEDEENEANAEAEAQKEGPWNRGRAAAVAETVVTPFPASTPTGETKPQEVTAAATGDEPDKGPETVKPEEPAAPAPAPGKFVPPHLRNKLAATAASGSGGAATAPPKPTTLAGDSGGKYLPIHMRQTTSSTAYRPKKAAPNIDEQNFPSLGQC